MLLLSPLEQFQILPLIPIRFGDLDISFSNGNLVTLTLIFILTFFIHLLLSSRASFYIVPSRWQVMIEITYETIENMLYDNLGDHGKQFFPFIFVLFTFVLFSNIAGLIPYSFTNTSHLIVTFTLAFAIFIGINIICVKTHGIHMISLFLPSGTSLGLALLLVPLELISYMFKPISLGVRLFANMMAGHTLLKVIAGFAYSMLMSGSLLVVAHVIPIFILILLVGLELGVAVIQAYVFTILTCIYLNDAINLH